MRRLAMIFTVFFGICLNAMAATQPAVSPEDAAASFVTEHDKAISANPAGLTFTLRTKDGRTTFHAGERIPIELVFENHATTKYSVLGFNASRGVVGRVDQFVSDRPGDAVDPQEFTEDEHRTGFAGFLAVGPISTSPVVASTDLNAWIALDQPGVYKLYDRTCRVTTSKDRIEAAFHLPTSPDTKPLASNIVTITILPHDTTAEQNTIQGSLRNLNGNRPWQAFYTIEYMRTLASGKALLQLAEEHVPYPQQAGLQQEIIATLAESPHKSELLQILRDDFSAPGIGITDMAVEAYVSIASHIDDTRTMKAHQNDSPRMRQAVKRQQVIQLLKTILETKRGSARAITLATLAYIHSYTDKEPYTRELMSCFDLLPSDQQYDLLKSNTPFAHDRAMEPVLINLLETQPVKNTPLQKDTREIALQSLLYYDPPKAHKIISDEIQKKWPTVNPGPLMHLPALPAGLDGTLLRNFQAASVGQGDIFAQAFLVGHFATAAIRKPIEDIFLQRKRVWQVIQSQETDVDKEILPPLFAYFYRVDPTFAEAQLSTVPDDLLDMRTSALVAFSPGLEKAIIARLDSADSNVVYDAAMALAASGAPRHKTILVSAMRSADTSNYRTLKINEALLAALTSARSWILNDNEYAALHTSVLSFNGQHIPLKAIHVIDMDAADWSTQYDLSTWIGGPWSVDNCKLVSKEELKEKLLQFPAGTTFQMAVDDKPWRVQVFDELKTFLQTHSMSIISSGNQ